MCTVWLYCAAIGRHWKHTGFIHTRWEIFFFFLDVVRHPRCSVWCHPLWWDKQINCGKCPFLLLTLCWYIWADTVQYYRVAKAPMRTWSLSGFSTCENSHLKEQTDFKVVRGSVSFLFTSDASSGHSVKNINNTRMMSCFFASFDWT